MSWDYVDGDGLWRRFKNTTTGEESIKTHELKLVKQWCPQSQHIFEITGNRTLLCKKCGQEVTYVLGKHKLDNGKLVEVKQL